MRGFLRSTSALAALGLLFAAQTQGQQAPLLRAPPAQFLADSARIVLQLPPSGGVAINHQPVAWNKLEAVLREIYEKRPTKVLLVDAAPERTLEDVQRVRRLADRQNIRVYAASLQGVR